MGEVNVQLETSERADMDNRVMAGQGMILSLLFCPL